MRITKKQLRKLIYESLCEVIEIDTGLGPDLSMLDDAQSKYILDFAVDNKGDMIDVHSRGNAPYILADPKSDGERSYVYAITKGNSENTPKITIVRSPKSNVSFKNPKEVKPGGKGYKAILKLFDTGRDNTGGNGLKPDKEIVSIKKDGTTYNRSKSYSTD